MCTVCSAAIIINRHVADTVAEVETQFHGRNRYVADALVQDYEELSLHEMHLPPVAEVGI